MTPITAWPLGPVKEPSFDRTQTEPPVYGLYSNAAEWTDSPPTAYDTRRQRDRPAQDRDQRVIRGAPPCVLREASPDDKELVLGPRWLTARWRQATGRDASFATVGFRCARSVTPRFLKE
jgi:formylglycine-generating enzyme required for sulfatase activity